MSDLRARMIEDRYLRNSARALVKADIDNLRTGLSQKGLGARAMDKAKSSAVEIYDEALELADDNRGALAALIAAVLVWFARNPILELLGFDTAADGNEEED